VITTAAQSLDHAHRAIFDVARKADVVLAGYEGLSLTLTYADIAAAVGLDLAALSRTDAFLTYLAIDAAVEHRGWAAVNEPGEPKQFRKMPKHTHHRKPAECPTARQRRNGS
jgi:hypothetical protein